MKYIASLFIAMITIGLISCGGGNDIATKKANLEQLKKQVLDINAQITLLEKELEKAGAADESKAALVNVDSVKSKDFNHFIELQGKVESESVSFVTPRAGGGQVKAIYVKRGDRVKKGQLILQLDNSLIKQSAAAAAQNIETIKAQAALAKSVYEKQKNLWDQNIGSEIQFIDS